jgi:hypothetical protein
MTTLAQDTWVGGAEAPPFRPQLWQDFLRERLLLVQREKQIPRFARDDSFSM